MALLDFFKPNNLSISFELFPPKTEKGMAILMGHVEKLVDFAPSFFTCTYGAGGSTQSKTLEIVEAVKKAHNIPVASHLTCVGATVDELRAYLNEARQRGVEYIVALRGDPPKGEESFTATEGGFSYANELVELIRSEFSDFGIAVAGYPEKHQEAPSLEVDLQNLKRKVDAGADIVVTQLFYCNEDFFKFREQYEQAGITAPLIPGILPVTNLSQIQRITSLCAAKLPQDFVDELGKKDDADWQIEVGIQQATDQVRELIDAGIPGLHFYVLNKSAATSRVLENLQLTG
ncbi:MAG: methylenetetrahydrofolate reductase [NAD(P)H] [Planctomycetota bacterium]